MKCGSREAVVGGVNVLDPITFGAQPAASATTVRAPRALGTVRSCTRPVGTTDRTASLGTIPVHTGSDTALDTVTAHRVGHRMVKTGFDILVAALLLLVLAPAMLIIAIAIRASSRGPALFRQTRVGRNGRQFTMYKFRSMCVDAEDRLHEFSAEHDGNGVLFKLRLDPRVTTVGRTLRRLSLDELPQLLNVVTGSMSLVGPRPPLPTEVAAYDTSAHRRLSVRPGITGLWQVSGRSNLSWEDSIRLDLRYVDDWSLSLDFLVLCKTARAVVTADGAY